MLIALSIIGTLTAIANMFVIGRILVTIYENN